MSHNRARIVSPMPNDGTANGRPTYPPMRPGDSIDSGALGYVPIRVARALGAKRSDSLTWTLAPDGTVIVRKAVKGAKA